MEPLSVKPLHHFQKFRLLPFLIQIRTFQIAKNNGFRLVDSQLFKNLDLESDLARISRTEKILILFTLPR